VLVLLGERDEDEKALHRRVSLVGVYLHHDVPSENVSGVVGVGYCCDVGVARCGATLWRSTTRRPRTSAGSTSRLLPCRYGRSVAICGPRRTSTRGALQTSLATTSSVVLAKALVREVGGISSQKLTSVFVPGKRPLAARVGVSPDAALVVHVDVRRGEEHIVTVHPVSRVHPDDASRPRAPLRCDERSPHGGAYTASVVTTAVAHVVCSGRSEGSGHVVSAIAERAAD
jgi:hypothetical protein